MPFNKKFITIILLTISFNISAQNLNSFIDYKGYLYAFDDGLKIKLYHQQIQSQQAGYLNVAYINNNNEFWIYDNKNQTKTGSFVTDYTVTDYLLAYRSYNNLFVYVNGMSYPLSNNCDQYFAGDSIIGFYDNLSRSIEVYYKNEVTQLDRNYSDDFDQQLTVKENMLAYFSSNGYFTTFYKGETYKLLPPNTCKSFKLGLNTVAYEDSYEEKFYGFCAGETYTIENRFPVSYQCGDNMVVYVNYEGLFMLFSNGKKREISSFSPSFYTVVDDMIVYVENGYFKVFYEGKSYELENYVPENYQIDKGSLAYLNQQGLLIHFNKGIKKKITTRKISNFSLVGNTLFYNYDGNSYNILYNGKVY